MNPYRQFIDVALAAQGCHYIWGGKGYLQFKDGGLKRHNFVDDKNVQLPVFDCSGLVTDALFKTTGMDLRGTHSSRVMLETFPIVEPDDRDELPEGSLILYPVHVAIDLGRGLVLDANGGDKTTVTILDAIQRGARVEVHRTNRPRATILGYRRIPLDTKELRVVQP